MYGPIIEGAQYSDKEKSVSNQTEYATHLKLISNVRVEGGCHLYFTACNCAQILTKGKTNSEINLVDKSDRRQNGGNVSQIHLCQHHHHDGGPLVAPYENENCRSISMEMFI